MGFNPWTVNVKFGCWHNGHKGWPSMWLWKLCRWFVCSSTQYTVQRPHTHLATEMECVQYWQPTANWTQLWGPHDPRRLYPACIVHWISTRLSFHFIFLPSIQASMSLKVKRIKLDILLPKRDAFTVSHLLYRWRGEQPASIAQFLHSPANLPA